MDNRLLLCVRVCVCIYVRVCVCVCLSPFSSRISNVRYGSSVYTKNPYFSTDLKSLLLGESLDYMWSHVIPTFVSRSVLLPLELVTNYTSRDRFIDNRFLHLRYVV